MSADHNRIKVSDLETNQPNQILTTNIFGELEFTNIDTLITRSPDPVTALQPGIVDNTPLQELGGKDKLIHTVRVGLGAGASTESIALGTNVLDVNTTGDFNTGVGFQVLKVNTTGSNNTGVGDWALYSNTIGNYNSALGSLSLRTVTTGSFNSAFGSGSLNKLTSGASNDAFGVNSLLNITTASFNTAIGGSTLRNLVNGQFNVAVGPAAGYNVTGSNNTVIGYKAMGFSGVTNTGNNNIVMGFQAGRDVTSGNNNILIENITNASITSGSNNIILDPVQKTGVTTGSNNVLLGGWNGAFAPGMSNTVALGTGAGVTRFLSSATGLNTLPTQTSALIIADTTGKAIATKEYVDNGGSVVNATISALSGTSLTSTYPNALLGFRVHCLFVTGGGLVYEKTTGGWIQYSAITVAP